jgi:hypothetical protein
VVVVGETAARPPKHGHLQRFEQRDDVVAVAVLVVALAPPDAVVDTPLEMLGEVPVKFGFGR